MMNCLLGKHFGIRSNLKIFRQLCAWFVYGLDDGMGTLRFFLLGHGRVSQKVQRCIPSKVNHFNWKIGRKMRIIRGEVTYEHCFSFFLVS